MTSTIKRLLLPRVLAVAGVLIWTISETLGDGGP